MFMPFLSLATVAGLTPEEHEVRIINDYNEKINFDENVDLVGLTALTSQAPRAYQIADAFRKKGVPVVMGGIHATMCTDEALKHVNTVVKGEAELLWQSLLSDLKEKKLKKIYETSEKPDLKNTPIPRFDLLKMNHFIKAPFSFKPLYLLPVQTSRGCPFNCHFCSVVPYLGTKIRKKPIEHVLKEISAYKSSYVFFTDDNIIGDPEYARELFKALIPLKIRWYSQISTNFIKHPDLIKLAAQSGCAGGFFGIETYNKNSLQFYNKKHNKPDEYKYLFKTLKDHGILADVSIMYGFDDDTYEDLLHMVEEVLSLDIHLLYLFIMTPLPGTVFYTNMLQNDRIEIYNWSKFDGTNPTMKFKNITSSKIMDAYWKSYKTFYSKRKIMKRLLNCGKQYLTNHPRNNFFIDLFLNISMHKTVKKNLHPFNLGNN